MTVFPQVIQYLRNKPDRNLITCEIIAFLIDRISKLFSDDFKSKQKYLMEMSKHGLVPLLL